MTAAATAFVLLLILSGLLGLGVLSGRSRRLSGLGLSGGLLLGLLLLFRSLSALLLSLTVHLSFGLFRMTAAAPSAAVFRRFSGSGLRGRSSGGGCRGGRGGILPLRLSSLRASRRPRERQLRR